MKSMMSKNCRTSTKVIKLFREGVRRPVKDLAIELGVNGTFLADNFKASENQEYVESKGVSPAKVYFNQENSLRGRVK